VHATGSAHLVQRTVVSLEEPDIEPVARGEPTRASHTRHVYNSKMFQCIFARSRALPEAKAHE